MEKAKRLFQGDVLRTHQEFIGCLSVAVIIIIETYSLEISNSTDQLLFRMLCVVLALISVAGNTVINHARQRKYIRELFITAGDKPEEPEVDGISTQPNAAMPPTLMNHTERNAS